MMEGDRWVSAGAGAGALAIALFAGGAVVTGDQPGFNASGAEVASHVAENRTRIQIACALNGAATPLLVWFLATVASLTRGGSPQAQRAGAVAFGCGLVFIALFLVDTTALAASALRPDNLAASPELATALRDLEWLPMGMAAPVGTAMLAALALIALGQSTFWPRWLGWLAALAAGVYCLRLGVLFTTEGPFSASGAIGLWITVGALTGWILIASVTLALSLRRPAPPPNRPKEPAYGA